MADQIRFKPAGIAETFEFNWINEIVETWQRRSRYVAGSIVAPPDSNGFFYVASLTAPDTFAVSSSLTPDFKPGHGETTQDGAIVWTANRPGAVSVPAINASVFTLDTGITEDLKAINGFETSVTISGGVAGEQYRVTNRITKSTGEIEEADFVLEILLPKDV